MDVNVDMRHYVALTMGDTFTLGVNANLWRSRRREFTRQSGSPQSCTPCPALSKTRNERTTAFGLRHSTNPGSRRTRSLGLERN